MKSSPQKSKKAEEVIKEEKTQWWLEASIIAAVVTALLFFLGVAYLQNYYYAFGVRFETLEIPSYWIITSCFYSILPILLPLIILLILRNLPRIIWGSDQNPVEKGIDWILYRNFGLIPIVAITLGYFYLVSYSGKQGTQNAEKLIANPTFFYSTFEVDGHHFEDTYYLYNNANYFYFFRPVKGTRPEIIIVPGGDIKNLRLGVSPAQEP